MYAPAPNLDRQRRAPVRRLFNRPIERGELEYDLLSDADDLLVTAANEILEA